MTDRQIEKKINRIAESFGILPGKTDNDLLFFGRLEDKPGRGRTYELRKWTLKASGEEISGKAIRLNKAQLRGLKTILNDLKELEGEEDEKDTL